MQRSTILGIQAESLQRPLGGSLSWAFLSSELPIRLRRFSHLTLSLPAGASDPLLPLCFGSGCPRLNGSQASLRVGELNARLRQRQPADRRRRESSRLAR